MSAIAWFLERAGIATTGISLVRENTVSFAPPRFLWVSFPLGRPLGRAHDPQLQHRVIDSALALLERPAGPVLEDFPEDLAPDEQDAGGQPLVCPVSFAGAPDSTAWSGRLAEEVGALSPWYERALSDRGRTTVGVLAEAPEVLAGEVGGWLDGEAPEAARLKPALEDLKAFYLESMRSQPGFSATAAEHWLWHETVLGEAMLSLRKTLMDGSNPELRALGDALVPRAVLHRR